MPGRIMSRRSQRRERREAERRQAAQPDGPTPPATPEQRTPVSIMGQKDIEWLDTVGMRHTLDIVKQAPARELLDQYPSILQDYPPDEVVTVVNQDRRRLDDTAAAGIYQHTMMVQTTGLATIRAIIDAHKDFIRARDAELDARDKADAEARAAQEQATQGLCAECQRRLESRT